MSPLTLLQAEEPQFSQPVLIGVVFHPLYHFCGPTKNSFPTESSRVKTIGSVFDWTSKGEQEEEQIQKHPPLWVLIGLTFSVDILSQFVWRINWICCWVGKNEYIWHFLRLKSIFIKWCEIGEQQTHATAKNECPQIFQVFQQIPLIIKWDIWM